MAETLVAPRSDPHPSRTLEAAVWPTFVGVGIGVLALGVALGHAELAYAALPAAGYGVLLLLERWLPRHAGAGALQDPRMWQDLAHNAGGNGVGVPLGDLLFVSAAAAAAGPLSEAWGATLWPRDWPWWVQAALVLFLADGLEYARHRAFHRVPWLWSMHVLHHDVDRLHAFKGGRAHALDMAARALAVYAPLVLLGLPRDLMWLYPAALGILGPISHANVAMRLPGWIHRWIVTPDVHRIHHARPLALSDRNFAAFFPLWDRCFGTFADPVDHGDPEVGVEPGSRIPDDFVSQLLWPFRRRRDAA